MTQERIEEKMDIVEESIRQLEGLNIDEDNFLEYRGVKHTLQEPIEAYLDIAGHMIAEEGFGKQQDYADYFIKLEQKNIIEEPLSKKLQEMARFRNLVVHRYSNINFEQVQQIIREDL